MVFTNHLLLRLWSEIGALSIVSPPSEIFDNSCNVDRRNCTAIDDLHPAASGLVRDCFYLGLYNFAAVEFDPHARAYVVVH